MPRNRTWPRLRAIWLLGCIACASAAQAASILGDAPAPAAASLSTPPGSITNAPATAVTNTVILGTPLGPDAIAAPPAADPAITAAEASASALSAAQVDDVISRIRAAYEFTAPRERLDEAAEHAFLQDVRQRLEAAKLPLPSTDPDDYKQHVYKDVPVTGERDAVIMGGEDGSLSVVEHNGMTVITYRDPNGVVLYEGPVESREDRQHIPFEVWKKYYEVEREGTVRPRGAPEP